MFTTHAVSNSPRCILYCSLEIFTNILDYYFQGKIFLWMYSFLKIFLPLNINSHYIKFAYYKQEYQDWIIYSYSILQNHVNLALCVHIS